MASTASRSTSPRSRRRRSSGSRPIGVLGLFSAPRGEAPADADYLTFDAEYSAFGYRLRRSARAKNIRITVGHEGVVVTLPERVAERHAHAFVRERAQWIERSLANLQDEADAVAARTLADGTTVPYLGEELTLRVLRGPSGRVHRAAGSGELRLHVPSGTRDEVAAALERWYRKRAREEMTRRLDAAVGRNGTHYEKIAIRDQRTRWGSCSSSGTISLNWRLMLAPEAVLDYVIEHEAAHIEVRDHSARFWALMEARVDDWRDSRDWLRRHGGALRLV